MCNPFCVCGADTSVTFPDTFRCHLRRSTREKGAGISVAKRYRQQPTCYAPTKNSSHESVAGGMQKPPRQHPILSPPVFDGHESDGDVIEDGGLQLPRPVRASKRRQSCSRSRAIRLIKSPSNPWGGNIDLMGLVDFAEMRPDCTEVTLAVHYEIKNKFYAWLDRRSAFCRRFPDLRTAQHALAFRRHRGAVCRSALPVLPMLEAGLGLTISRFCKERGVRTLRALFVLTYQPERRASYRDAAPGRVEGRAPPSGR